MTGAANTTTSPADNVANDQRVTVLLVDDQAIVGESVRRPGQVAWGSMNCCKRSLGAAWALSTRPGMPG